MNKTISALFLTCGVALFVPATASAAAGKYHITAEEQTACGPDAIELCMSTYPDEDKLLACMKVNRLNLSPACRPIFEEGIRRRHLN